MIKELETYFNLMTMNGCIHVYMVAQDLGVFGLLEAQALTAPEIAKKLSLSSSHTKLMLTALSDLGLLEKTGARYSSAKVTTFLKGNYRALGNEYWQHLPKLLKTGESLALNLDKSLSEAFYMNQVSSLEWMMLPSAHCLTKALPLKSGSRILDLGAGSGVWSTTYLQHFSDARATLVDWPNVIKIAQHYAETKKVDNRITFVGTDYKLFATSEKYHLILLGNVTHLESADSLKALFKKCWSMLSPDGILLIVDVMNTNKKGRLAKSLYELGLVIRNANVKLYTKSELKKFLLDAGFSSFDYKSLNITPYVMGAITAR